MIRLDLPYEQKRSSTLMKRKEFQDAEFARSALSTLDVDPSLVSAALYSADGEVFGTYDGDGVHPARVPSRPIDTAGPDRVTVVRKRHAEHLSDTATCNRHARTNEQRWPLKL